MDAEGDVKVLGTVVSPFALRVRMALYLKGVSYEYLEQDLFDKGELLVASNPYVDEFWAGTASILPADPYHRAVARFWAAYVDDKVFPAWIGILRAATEEERDEKLAATLAVVAPMEDAFTACSDGKAFFSGGDSVGYLDLALGCQLFWLEALRSMFGVKVIDAGRTPRLAAWAERFLETKAAKAVAPPANSMEEYAGKLRAIWAAAAAAK
ncbi:hypothetical protein ACQ4PT_057783 [Festuca glaucescens]